MKRCKNQVPDIGGRFLLMSSLILLLFTGLFSPMRAQTAASVEFATLKGFVFEKNTKIPVEFATMQVLPQGAFTMTGINGVYIMERLSPGRINIKIQFLGMETLDTTLNLPGGRVTEVTFYMANSSFRLNEVRVVATESKAGQATASNISRQAMDHLQTSSLSDVLQLLPGGVVTNSSLSSSKTFSIRNIDKGTSTAEMNSLGTAIYIDGAPISNNSNLQALSPVITGAAGVVGGGSSPESGFDIRSISTDNIESVEVIRGIPSVEYGDLTSGAVIVRSKAGKEPLTIRFKTDPHIYQTSVSKGLSLGGDRGNLNLSGDYAYSSTERTESYVYYQRVTAKALYSNVFGNLSSNSSIDVSLGKDSRDLNPNDQRNQLESGASDLGIRLNSNGTWNINKGWLNNIAYTFAGTYRNKHSYKQELLGNAFAAYSMSRTDGAVLSNIPGRRVYDVDGNELTNIPREESAYYATYLPNEYFNRYDIYGKEINVFAKVNANFSKRSGNIFNRILVGAEFKTDGNLGKGKVYELDNPPYRVLSSENSSPRPRKYSDIPFIEQLGIFAEENMVWTIAEKRDLTLQIGARFDLIEKKSILSPRINGSFEIVPEALWIRAGYGMTAKAPTTLYLYPENAYFDFVHYNTLNKSGVPKAEQLMLNTTRVFETTNPDLKIASNRKSEVGFDLKVKKMRFSVTAYNEQLVNGYNLGHQIENYKLIEYVQYQAAAASQPGKIPVMEEKSRDNVFVSYASPMNNLRAHNRGVEFDFDLGRFEAIRTSFVLNGAYMRTTEWNDGYSFSSNSNLNSLEKNIAIYEPAKQKEERERFVTTLRATHNIPSIGFVLTLTAQVNWKYKYWTTYGNDSVFVKYISHIDGQVLDNTNPDDPALAYMYSSKSPTRFIAEAYFPVPLINFHLTKEIGDKMKASFYANNMFNSRPKYESKRTPGSFSRLNIPMFFGFEFTLMIK